MLFVQLNYWQLHFADKRDNEKLEDDCILSQFAKEDEEDEFDLTLPLEPTTPTKINVDEQISDSESDGEHNRTTIPQVDGTYSDSDVIINWLLLQMFLIWVGYVILNKRGFWSLDFKDFN